jgi:Flp pilus assembly protein TadG
VSILLALAIVPLLLAAGAAIDYIRLNNARTELQAALDGAALAAALPKEASNAARITMAKDFFAANIHDPNMAELIPDIVITASSVVAKARMALPTSFMRLAGISAMDLEEFAEVARPGAGKAEVVLVLDYSGSMNKKGKYQAMRDAAGKMIDNLGAALPSGHLKIGLVPFSAMVYTSMSKSFVVQPSASATWTGCTQDRKFPYNTTIDTPTSDNVTK